MTTIKRRARVTTTIELNAHDIVTMLRQAGHLLDQVRDKLSVKFHVPGGGDWSNMAVEVSSDAPIVVTWETVEEEPQP